MIYQKASQKLKEMKQLFRDSERHPPLFYAVKNSEGEMEYHSYYREDTDVLDPDSEDWVDKISEETLYEMRKHGTGSLWRFVTGLWKAVFSAATQYVKQHQIREVPHTIGAPITLDSVEKIYAFWIDPGPGVWPKWEDCFTCRIAKTAQKDDNPSL